jgi:peptidoglycan/xylan/chitin deacetylase (PgdA/CDA1 family)
MSEGQTTVRLDRGAFVVSIDTEMAWGLAHVRDGSRGPAAASRRGDFADERRLVAQALDVFGRHGIPGTFAVVGHLFLDRCSREAGGRAHPGLARPAYPWLGDDDWYAIDPATTLAEAPSFYGRDLVEQIAACPVRQELACHGFSHAMIGDEGCPAEVLDSELEASAEAAGGLGVTLRSFVYPRNSIGHLAGLAAHGYVAYRGSRVGPPFRGRPSWQRSALRAVDRVRPLAGSAVQPARHAAGVWNVPQTYLFAPATQRSWLPVGIWVRRPIARLRQAARHRSLFHLWFHPYNLTAAPERAIAALDRICARAARLRDAGRLDVVTMGGLADRLTAAGAASAASAAPAVRGD